jgi:V/A-type H+-transporting ATPase subunit E
MGLEEVKQEVLEKAREKAESIINEAKAEANKIMDKVKEEIREQEKIINEDTKKRITLMERKDISSAEIDIKKNFLQAKKEVINDVFNRVKEKLKKDSKIRKELIQRLLKKTESEIKIAKIYCNKQDKSIFKDYNLEFIDILGGFIAENNDATIRINHSFDVILESIKEKELGKIDKILFE